MRFKIKVTLVFAIMAVAATFHVFGTNCDRVLPGTSLLADTGTRQLNGLVTPAMEWMYVQERMDGTFYEVYDSVLRIHYNEPYTVSNHQRLRFKVYDKYRNVIAQTDNAGNITNSACDAMTPSPSIKTGENWLTINLGCFNLNEGEYYYMEVWNGKGEKGYLRFKVMPS